MDGFDQHGTSQTNTDPSNAGHTKVTGHDIPKGTVLKASQPCPACGARKGILKKVRFPGESEPLKEESGKERTAHVQLSSSALSSIDENRVEEICKPKSSPLHPSIPPLPAPPPPPPPPPPPSAPRPPTLFNNGIEANEYLNAAAFKLYTSFIDELYEFVAQQKEVIATRLFVQERRKELHRLREHVSECDLLLINSMRERMNGGDLTDRHIMIELFEASQAARDQIGPVEAEYEPLEIILGSKEHQLVEKYSKIEGSFEHFFRLNITPTSKLEEPSIIEYEASSVTSSSDHTASLEGLEHLHGALIGENVGIGQLPMRAGKLKYESMERQETGISRPRTASLGSSDFPRPRSAIFLEEGVYSNGLSGTLDFIGIWTNDLTKPAGVDPIFETRNAYERTSLEGNHIEVPDALQDSMDDFPVNPGLEEGNPLLLLDEGNETRAILSDYLVGFESTPDRVNRWMLHQLRVSPREIYALHGQITHFASNPLHWATSVLKQWPHDSFGHGDHYDQESVEFGESVQNPQALGYHGACPPECRRTHDWPKSDAWLAHQSSTFSNADIALTRPVELGTESYIPNAHELSTASYDHDHD
ncbi:unnamed protein product [Alternaria alternata]